MLHPLDMTIRQLALETRRVAIEGLGFNNFSTLYTFFENTVGKNTRGKDAAFRQRLVLKIISSGNDLKTQGLAIIWL